MITDRITTRATPTSVAVGKRCLIPMLTIR
jgi:hypothetical protein